MRSLCRRSIITMSTPASPRAMSWNTSTPSRSIAAGSNVRGATTRTRAPMVLRSVMFERAIPLRSTSLHLATNTRGAPPDPALAAANRQRVEQGLGRVLVAAVAGIDDGTIDLLGEQMNRPRFGVADDQHVGMDPVQGH